MDINTFMQNFADAIEDVQFNQLTEELDFKNELEQWDSLAVMTTLAMIDSEYNVILEGKDIEKCKTISQLFDLVKSKSEA
ncbi:MAG: acyl carrier protein [Ignavibacteriae bacterium]|nr:acyl carrier protein [Ignavibacteriota bacterium]